MRCNENTVLVGERVVLVPYCHHHVQRYHEWMKDEALQEQTASEPLTLEQEYDMMRKWREDEDKLTFIVLDRQRYDTTGSEEEAMIGDVNLFLNDPDSRHVGEMEVMIAEQWARGRGCGKEAVLMMMEYTRRQRFQSATASTTKAATSPTAQEDKYEICAAVSSSESTARCPPPKHAPLNIGTFVAKIGQANKPSIAMFTKLGYVCVSSSQVFKEDTLHFVVEQHQEWLPLISYEARKYNN